MIIRLLLESFGRLTVSIACMFLIYNAYLSGKISEFLTYLEIPGSHAIYFLYAALISLTFWVLLPPVNKLFE
jgi:hypothetical protein